MKFGFNNFIVFFFNFYTVNIKEELFSDSDLKVINKVSNF